MIFVKYKLIKVFEDIEDKFKLEIVLIIIEMSFCVLEGVKFNGFIIFFVLRIIGLLEFG